MGSRASNDAGNRTKAFVVPATTIADAATEQLDEYDEYDNGDVVVFVGSVIVAWFCNSGGGRSSHCWWWWCSSSPSPSSSAATAPAARNDHDVRDVHINAQRCHLDAH